MDKVLTGKFKKYLYCSNNRERPEFLLKVSEEVLAGDVCIEHRAAAFVVYIYKSLETVSGICGWRSHGFEICQRVLEKISSKEDFSKLGVREDPVQLYISVMTAMWHASIYENESPLELLDGLLKFTRRIDKKASYSLNIGNAYLLLSYILFLQGRKNEAKHLISEAYGVFIELVESSKNELPSSSHFGDMMKMMKATQSMLAGYEWIEGERKRESLWSDSKVMLFCSRVDVREFDAFKNKFSDILRSFSPYKV